MDQAFEIRQKKFSFSFFSNSLSSLNLDFFGKKIRLRGFPGGPVVRTWHCHCGDLYLMPGRGTRIPQAAWHSQLKAVMIIRPIPSSAHSCEDLVTSWKETLVCDQCSGEVCYGARLS